MELYKHPKNIEIPIGTYVILGEHTRLDGFRNWNDNMGAYVGNLTRIRCFSSVDISGCRCYFVEGNKWEWRSMNMKVLNNFKKVFFDGQEFKMS